jgi:hypothetical protein
VALNMGKEVAALKRMSFGTIRDNLSQFTSEPGGAVSVFPHLRWHPSPGWSAIPSTKRLWLSIKSRVTEH